MHIYIATVVINLIVVIQRSVCMFMRSYLGLEEGPAVLSKG